MSNYSLQAINLNKTFGRRLIFKDLNFKIEENGITGISGANGSGKSTLVKILAGVNSPTSGKVIHIENGKEILPEKLHNYIGFVSPYLVLYEEFSAWENLTHFAKIRGVKFNNEKIEYLLNQFLLFDRRNDYVKTYSSGMKQRLKFIFALMHSPKLIILDEPTSNLDAEGKDSVYKIIDEESKSGIVIIASNEKSDLALCSKEIKLEEFKNHK
ncbi:MAG: ABC transporter ATP-binding protein [Ignavibacteriaceae bacterium]|nr:ABC transporter ATP-binding protein [Ignavibacteriaceae bacterium]